MALQFQPPPDWLVQNYIQQKNQNPVVDALSGVAGVMQQYAQQKQQQQTENLSQQQKDIEMAKGIAGNGQDFTDALKQIQGARTPTQTPSLIDRAKAFFSKGQPISTGQATAPTPGQQSGPMTPASPVPPPVQSTATVSGMSPGLLQQPPAQAPTSSPLTDPLVQQYQQDPLAFKKQHGSAGIDKLKTQMEIDKGLQEKAPKGPEGYYDASGNKKFDLPPGSHLLPASDLNVGTKESNQQDKLEQQYRQSFQSIRGDPSIKRAEEQRDAAAIAYNRIKEVKDHGQVLNPIDYIDVLGQIYKARTGSAPTNEVLSTARQETAKGQYGKAYTYLTGDQAPATTENIMQSLQDMALSMGTQADKFHDGYMRSRMKPPLGLAHDRVANVNAERGMSFAEATGQNQQDNSIPIVGGTFQGGKVLSVKKIK